MKGKRFIAATLSLLLTVSPLAACTSAAESGGGAAEEEMVRELGDVGTISVPFSSEGNYEVTFSEYDLVGIGEEEMSRGDVDAELVPEDEPVAEDGAEATEGDELTVDEGAVEATDADSDVVEDDAVTPDGQASTEDAIADEGDEKADGEAELTEVVAEEGLTLADVTLDDVRVVYQYPLIDSDELYEDREAPITDYANEDGAVTLSFTNPEVEEEFSPAFFDIVIERLGSHVEVYPEYEEPELVTVDYDAQLEDIQYEPSFSEEDIALPEGVEIYDGNVVVTDEASEAVVDALEDDPSVEMELSRGTDPWKVADKAVEYTTKGLGYVNKDAGKVAKYGESIYQIVKSAYKGDIGGLYKSGKNFLTLVGVLKKKQAKAEVTNEQILEELQGLKEDVADLRDLVTNMNAKLDKALQEDYAIHLQLFDDAVYAIGVNAGVVSSMLQKGAVLAEERGIEVPEEDAQAEEQFEYNRQLKALIVAEQNSGNEAFAGFDRHAEDLRKNMNTVNAELAKTGTFSPLAAYDSYWDLYFNWHTQGWYLRQSYRSNIEYQLKAGFACLAVYYNIGSPKVGTTYDGYVADTATSLTALEKNPAGVSPEQAEKSRSVYNSWNVTLGKPVYSATFDKTATKMLITSNLYGGDWQKYKFDSSVLKTYVSKLHGNDVEQDLRLAGLWGSGANYRWERGSNRVTDDAHGIGINAYEKKSKHYVDLLTWEGKIHEKVLTYNKWETIKNAYEDVTAGRILYVTFTFA